MKKSRDVKFLCSLLVADAYGFHPRPHLQPHQLIVRHAGKMIHDQPHARNRKVP